MIHKNIRTLKFLCFFIAFSCFFDESHQLKMIIIVFMNAYKAVDVHYSRWEKERALNWDKNQWKWNYGHDANVTVTIKVKYSIFQRLATNMRCMLKFIWIYQSKMKLSQLIIHFILSVFLFIILFRVKFFFDLLAIHLHFHAF